MASKLGIVLALHPRYAQLIYDGKKRAELRRSFGGPGTRVVFIYETAPVSAVTGFFLVKGFRSMRPQSAWREFDGKLGLTHAEFNEYVHGCDEVKILEIGKTAKLPAPLTLRAFTGRDSAPQSFCYVSRGLPKSVGSQLRELGEASARWPDGPGSGLPAMHESLARP
jgi:predicted transcriptional regulator